jgi:AraC-like DNA-binding protein
MRPLSRSPALRWLMRYLDAVLTDPADAEASSAVGEVQRLIVSHVYDIAGAAITATRESTLFRDGLGIRAARLRAIRSHILANLGSPQLTVAAVAAHHGITPRYLHKLFETQGTSYSAFVLTQRLRRVHRMLTDLRWASRPISALAFDVGFGDLSYFNREFKRRFNATPSNVRREALAAWCGTAASCPHEPSSQTAKRPVVDPAVPRRIRANRD